MNPIRTTIAALLGIAASAAAFAQYTGPGAQQPVRTVADILKNPVDDQNVELTGKLVRQDGRERFTFSDGTAEITVEIDEDEFPAGRPVSADTRVHIRGEVETRWRGAPRIDVDKLSLEGAAPATTPMPAASAPTTSPAS